MINKLNENRHPLPAPCIFLSPKALLLDETVSSASSVGAKALTTHKCYPWTAGWGSYQHRHSIGVRFLLRWRYDGWMQFTKDYIFIIHHSSRALINLKKVSTVRYLTLCMEPVTSLRTSSAKFKFICILHGGLRHHPILSSFHPPILLYVEDRTRAAPTFQQTENDTRIVGQFYFFGHHRLVN